MSLRIDHFGLTDTGRVRAGNEDAWAADEAQGLYIVADGMGGHNAGEIASQMVVSSLPKLMQKRGGSVMPRTSAAIARRLRSAVSRLSRDVFEQASAEPHLSGMGATVVAVMIHAGEAIVVHMGDSRVYLLRDGRLRLLTRDHSVIQILLDSGHITPEQAQFHPDRNRITASIGMPGDPTPDSRRVALRTGDRVLLCTDGLANMVDDLNICRIMGESATPEATCRNLIDAANAAGGDDNITAVVLEVHEEK
ncbi:Stp1/IreP family PP2C-type Ser/Thr phosphatase [Humisphaera borealis]|uniref:Stp1/IreP family PP2C-type Ser/Thr phosphatase n=1 Tax=Humisphaera borealis TaxID=2807512 RepID=A0A7M2WRA0_9BACT|nr:Stp1/IreP family PP2C-type Ser/Thr phosphatase [Humisphaera borealis]QOV87929.1 Stp1/IreP family PP2C-type Ser/Thr phosphatase [Humisphaera borealis]